MPDAQSSILERWLRIVGAALTLIGILAGLYQFSRTQAINAARPFLEKKLKWCEEAVETAAGIAIYGRESVLAHEGAGSPSRRVDRFWSLYWGTMGMVENQDVIDAMVKFGDGLKTSETSVMRDVVSEIDLSPTAVLSSLPVLRGRLVRFPAKRDSMPPGPYTMWGTAAGRIERACGTALARWPAGAGLSARTGCGLARAETAQYLAVSTPAITDPL